MKESRPIKVKILVEYNFGFYCFICYSQSNNKTLKDIIITEQIHKQINIIYMIHQVHLTIYWKLGR